MKNNINKMILITGLLIGIVSLNTVCRSSSKSSGGSHDTSGTGGSGGPKTIMVDTMKADTIKK